MKLLEPGDPEPVVATPAAEYDGKISPDGSLLAFDSLETGSDEIFVVQLATGRRWRISQTGGGPSAWSPTTHEILYRTAAGLFPATFALKPDFEPSVPQLLRPHSPGVLRTQMVMTPDAERFVTRLLSGDRDGGLATPRIDVVLNWFTELLERAPSDR